jgi:hypothetical protein
MTGPTPTHGEPPRSGLRDPARAARGVGAAALSAEGLVLLLALVPLRVLGADLHGASYGVLLALVAACVVFAGSLRRPWVWHAAWVLHAAVFACGLVFHPVLAVLGVLFGLLWAYVLRVRRTVTV